MKVPFVDLRAEYKEIRDEVDAAMRSVIEESHFILGPEVETFEDAFTHYIGTRYCISVSSGTEALKLALEAIEVKPGDEVVLPVNTFVATALAVTALGAIPRFVDCEEDSFLIDMEKVHDVIGPRTKAFIPVHLYGRVVDLDAVNAAISIPVIEDAAQAHGAESNGKRAGSVGLAGCFSFYPSKNLGAYGDGGAVVTSDNSLREQLKLLRNYGQTKKYHHEVKGGNSRLDGIQAAVLSVKLKYLDKWNVLRRTAASFYTENLKEGIPRTQGDSVYHLYVIRIKNRDELREKLASEGIATGIHYPIPLHLQGCFKDLPFANESFPIAEKLSGEILSLPMYPHIQPEQLEYVVEKVNQWGEPV